MYLSAVWKYLMICGAVQYIQYYQAKSQQYDRSLRDRLWPYVTSSSKCCSGYVYATLLFGDSVCYFLWRILIYTCGWLELPRFKAWRKNRHK